MASAGDTHSEPSLWRRLALRYSAWRNAKIASPAFQSWASAFPLTRPVARREAEKLYDLVAGFAYSQTLLACVELDVLRATQGGPRSPEDLARRAELTPERMTLLCQAAAALDLLERHPDGRYGLGKLGAASLGVPGLLDMIRHHAAFYRDLADPVALLRGEAEPELARFWSYVDGARDQPGDVAATYSELMASSQTLVAEETLRTVSFSGARRLLDVGGGAGAFITAVARRYPTLGLGLFDLPAVVDEARRRLAGGPAASASLIGGSFLEDPLPSGFDVITLVRVLYDHGDDTVERLLQAVFDALPAGGRLVISEPMSGGARPTRAGDVYFGLYTLAMTSGRPRSPERHAELLAEAGFDQIRPRPTARQFVTGVIEARKPL